MRTLKCLLLHILRTTGLQHIVCEIYFDETDFSPLPEHLKLIIKILTTGYNLTEPEHSRMFPLVRIDILLPQIFSCRSALLTDASISHVYYNPETEQQLPLGLINERAADQTMPPVEQVVPIDTIKKNALVFAIELLRPAMGVIEQQEEENNASSRPLRIFKRRSSLLNDPQETDISTRSTLFKYEIVCMGGTFDHMHLGHRLLLTQACLVTRNVLHVGVTSDTLLTKKAYASFIEPYEKRVAQVKDFLDRLAPHLDVRFFELSDPVGLAADLEEIGACVLTKETQKGGLMINEARAAKGFQALDLVFADMILTADPSSPRGDTEVTSFSNKMSSTIIRQFMSTTDA
eukprot:CAMPEP_0185568170 /NCGR_PEP_ID=MMETSP0434-20130131/1211_1 /TAXON_ID=626734 ORGANISM="Favella taraikaensis, Strain Fe Narragansett Bay" /NCGR_SAMPLE_ID=MMETSP0434 /ASSEMBLY_ACC=CAM_ASM_000379 /LENGTH=346 /DNA_ID=CAMNT_0028182591 /DNA_START=161 /DNA_END=1201 /DNA_ORIENTATION=+